MIINILSAILGITLAIFSTGSQADIISLDWQTPGDNLITLDTNSGLQWLDTTVTLNRSYNDISASLGAGQELDGWRYATAQEVIDLWIEMGVTVDDIGQQFDFVSIQPYQDVIGPIWGDTWCHVNGCAPGDGYTEVITGDLFDFNGENTRILAIAGRHGIVAGSTTAEYRADETSIASDAYLSTTIGNALVHTTLVPVPASLWLLGSGLLSLLHIARRRSQLEVQHHGAEA